MSVHIITRRIAFASICLMAAVCLAVFALVSSPTTLKGAGEALVGGPFALINQEGETVTEKTFLGRPMLMFFGFTYCPDICPTTMQVLSEALRQVPEKNIQPVMVSVDPARDTPEQLSAYIENFPGGWIALTGTPAQLEAMAQTYKAAFKKVENKDRPEDYSMDHTSIIYLMGADGKFLKHFTYTTDAKALAGSIKVALAAQ